MPERHTPRATRGKAGIKGGVFAVVAAAALALGTPQAHAAYSVQMGGTPSGPGTCDSLHATQPYAGGFFAATLPPGPNNLIVTHTVNGGTPFVQLVSDSTAIAGGQPELSIELFVPTAPPYVAVDSVFPALNGVPVGTGTVVTATCSAEGVASVTFTSGVPAGLPGTGSAFAVPTLAPAGLAVLLAVLALAGAMSRLPSRRR
ncbi:MAG: hypothetical protein JSR18_11725 [Proteobacteria bacterium]|nr:hypothetical protein [Pseudomonadota bacterium]